MVKLAKVLCSLKYKIQQRHAMKVNLSVLLTIYFNGQFTVTLLFPDQQTEMVLNRVFFSLRPPNWIETSFVWVPYNKLLNNLACSSCTKQYWPSVRTIMTSGRYSQYGPSLNYNLTSRWRSNRIWGSNGREKLFPEKQNNFYEYYCGHQWKSGVTVFIKTQNVR